MTHPALKLARRLSSTVVAFVLQANPIKEDVLIPEVKSASRSHQVSALLLTSYRSASTTTSLF
jgi:hypothetical protein